MHTAPLALILALFACDHLVDIPVDPDCDNLEDLHCAYPFPSDRWLVDDPSTPTGLRLELPGEAMPANRDGVQLDASSWRPMDGYTPGTRILTVFERDVDLSAVAFHDSIERSLDPDHATVLLDLKTGERLPHWVELDAQRDPDEPTVVLIHTTEVLSSNRAYGVAIRGLSHLDGTSVTARPGFAALRDGRTTEIADLEDRREAYESLFEALDGAGVTRGELIQAWRFHTSSEEVRQSDLRTMWADAAQRLGDRGLGCTITEVTEDWIDPELPDQPSFRKLQGTFTVPHYLDSERPPARIQRGPDNAPIWTGDVEIPFTVIVPYAAQGSPSRAVVYGHGLMSKGDGTISNTDFRDLGEELNITLFATDWIGMSADDLVAVAVILTDISHFPDLSERLHQAVVNQLALVRSVRGVCADQPALQDDSGAPVYSPSDVYFGGGSQGGILGGTTMALMTDIDRGLLLVNGASFPLMMERSIDFAPYLPVLEQWYPNRVDRALTLPIVHQQWSTVEPDGWLHHLREPGAPTVLSMVAHNDSQVPNLASDFAMRSAGAVVVEGSSRQPWGFEVAQSGHDPLDAPAFLSIDVGDRPVPDGNEAATVNDHGHHNAPFTPTGRAIIDSFLRPGGRITVPCAGPCDPD